MKVEQALSVEEIIEGIEPNELVEYLSVNYEEYFVELMELCNQRELIECTKDMNNEPSI